MNPSVAMKLGQLKRHVRDMNLKAEATAECCTRMRRATEPRSPYIREESHKAEQYGILTSLVLFCLRQ